MKINELNILYEDKEIIVCAKPHGLAVQSRNIGVPDMTRLLKNHIFQNEKTGGEPYLAVIHRLDQPVAGVLVFAKTPVAAKELNRQLQNGEFGKYYRALVENNPPAEKGIVENYVEKDGRTNTSHICQKGSPSAKLARLRYETVGWGRGIFENAPSPTYPELEIQLDTGRHHQIRVQLANLGCPIIGDTKYNPNAATSTWQTLCLCAYKLTFKHPKSGRPMEFLYPTPIKKGEV